MRPMRKNMPHSMGDRIPVGYFRQMKLPAAIVAGAMLLAAPAHAIVGGGVPSAGGRRPLPSSPSSARAAISAPAP